MDMDAMTCIYLLYINQEKRSTKMFADCDFRLSMLDFSQIHCMGSALQFIFYLYFTDNKLQRVDFLVENLNMVIIVGQKKTSACLITKVEYMREQNKIQSMVASQLPFAKIIL